MSEVTTPDFDAIKARQQATWATGDYAVIAAQVQFVSEVLCETVDIRAGSDVLDVACGSGNASLSAARRGANVTGIDYVGQLLERARERASAEALDITFLEADAENLPFDAASFDTVLSVVGVMFAPDQERAASELARVTRPGGKIALACWTPGSFVGQIFKTVGSYVSPPPGLRSPMQWGTPTRLEELFGEHGKVEIIEQTVTFRDISPQVFVERFKTLYGPAAKAFEALDAAQAQALEADLVSLVESHDRLSGVEAVAVPGTYIEIIVTRA